MVDIRYETSGVLPMVAMQMFNDIGGKDNRFGMLVSDPTTGRPCKYGSVLEVSIDSIPCPKGQGTQLMFIVVVSKSVGTYRLVFICFLCLIVCLYVYICVKCSFCR